MTAGRTLHQKAQRDGTAFKSILMNVHQVGTYQRGQVVAYHDNLLCIVRHEDAEETVYKVFAMNIYQWFRAFNALLL